MSLIPRRKKTRSSEAVDLITDALNLAAVAKAASGAKKAAKGAAAYKGGKAVAKRVVPIAALGAVGLVAAKKLRGGEEPPAWTSAPSTPTPAQPPASVA